MKKAVIVVSGVLLLALLSLLPQPQYHSDDSRILFSSQNELLRVWLNENEQYRFPKSSRISDKYKTAVLHFEDKRFYRHWGIDFFAVMRAAKQNLSAKRIESGASTITMQLARLQNPSKRTFAAKLKEAHTALRMELWFSKDEIFEEYASLVPMGGNIIGIETASWRFFGHSAEELTWAEAALLALLPNKPSALNLKKERDNLLRRRNILLQSLAKSGAIDAETLYSAIHEPLPQGNTVWKFKTPHYAEAVASLFPGEKILQGTIDENIQNHLEKSAKEYGIKLKEYSHVNVSVLITETVTGKIRGYLGSLDYYDAFSKGMIDGIRAHRSTGSTLKPFLYGLAMEKRQLSNKSLLEDIPVWYRGFSPQNADKHFSGLVTLEDALTRSLNVPAVNILADYGVENFYDRLQEAGLKKLFRSPEDYGLSLILGGAEASLAELTPLYSMLMNDGKRTDLKWLESESDSNDERLLQEITAFHIREILTNVKRPGFEEYSVYFNNHIPVAWKTGTSYGSRDAWAIGVNAEWTIGVWVGNFEGGSVNGLSGASSAAPLLFTLFNTLSDPKKELWKDFPFHADYETIRICTLSGYKASEFCPHTVDYQSAKSNDKPFICPFHQKIIVSKKYGYEVCSLCWDADDTLHVTEARYSAAVRNELRKIGREPTAETVHNPLCKAKNETLPFSIRYPEFGARLFLPGRDAVSEMGFVALAAHKERNAELQWFLNGIYLGNTRENHNMAITAPGGEHRLGVQDSLGRYSEVKFRVSRRN
jgi:penicillin-binding protein 1C